MEPTVIPATHRPLIPHESAVGANLRFKKNAAPPIKPAGPREWIRFEPEGSEKELDVGAKHPGIAHL